MNDTPNFAKGLAWGLLAFLTWGFVPIYWKFLHGIPFTEVLGHRIVWASLMLGVVLLVHREFSEFKIILSKKKNVYFLIATTILILINWNLFIWAVDNNYIVECSLGYFINPLLNVFLGVVLLKERLKTYQWFCVALAFVGILIMLFSNVGKPAISLGLALSFALYGLLKKQMKVSPLHSLFFETASLVIPTLIYFSFLASKSEFVFLSGTNTQRWLMIGAGAVTVIPLLAFGHAVKNLPLTTVGIMQYITPSLQLMAGVFLYGETFGTTHAIAFGLIWTGLLIYTLYGFLDYKRKARETNEASLSA